MLPLLGGKPLNSKQPYNPVHRHGEKNPYHVRIQLQAVASGCLTLLERGARTESLALVRVSLLMETTYGWIIVAASPLSVRQSMSAYLITCECGKNVPVEIGQAGGQIVCTCGTRLDVPPLRKLRHLPVAAPAGDQTRAAWNTRKGLITGSLIVATVLASIALWLRISEPSMPKVDPQTHQRLVDRGIEALTPVQAWQRWIDVYTHLAEHGFSEFVDPRAPAIEQHIAKRRFLEQILAAIAGVSAAIALAAALWPNTTRRQGDKETGRNQ
jgi:hypothetical protein